MKLSWYQCDQMLKSNKSCPIVVTRQFLLKSDVVQNCPERICRQVLLKIAQSGHTFGFASNQRTKETLFRSRNGIRSAHYSLIAAKTLLNLNLYFELQLCFKIGFDSSLWSILVKFTLVNYDSRVVI